MIIDSQDLKVALDERAKKYSEEIKVHSAKGNSYMVNWLTGIEMSLLETVLAIRAAEEATIKREQSNETRNAY